MHGEGMIATDPTDARRLIACSMFLTERTGQSIAVYRSDDGAAHWQRTFETPLDDFTGDPACTFGPDGVAYLTMMPFKNPTMAAMRLPLYISGDGGTTWYEGGVTGGMDRESIAVDATGGRYDRRIYIHGTVSVRGTGGIARTMVSLYASSDGGRTFGRPASWASLGRGYIYASGNGVVLSEGRWLTAFTEIKAYFDGPLEPKGAIAPTLPEPENAWLKIIASDDGGDTLREPVTVSGEHLPNGYVRMTGIVPAIAADATQGPFKDRVYVAWTDSRFGGTDILFSYSSDCGETWSAPMVVNDNPRWSQPPPNHLVPAIAVNREGVVAVAWLDRRNARDGLGWEERLRVSTDGGETFLPSALVSEAPARFGANDNWPAQAYITGGGTPIVGGGLLNVTVNAPRFLYEPGDYATVAADANGVFHPYWIDNRTGWHQVWTAAVTVAAKATRNGSEALAALEDVTARTTLRRISTRYDRATSTVAITVCLANTGAVPLDGPFTLRLIHLGSDVADVSVSGAVNGERGPGATWLVPDERLEPGRASEPITLTFTLSNVHPFVQGHTDHFDLRLVKFDARVLAR